MIESSRVSKEDLERHFLTLKTCVGEALNRRLQELLREVNTIEKAAIQPLEKCEVDIRQEIKLSMDILDGGEHFIGMLFYMHLCCFLLILNIKGKHSTC